LVFLFGGGSGRGPLVRARGGGDVADVLRGGTARFFLCGAPTARHEHEYVVWESVKLPAGKIIVPGMVTHSTDVVEHPQLVSQRIQRFTKLVGKENVMAGAACGPRRAPPPPHRGGQLQHRAEGAARAAHA